MVRVSLFYIFGSIEDSWIPITVPAFNILQQIVLFEIYEKNLASCRYEMGKERSILIFLDNWVIVFGQYIKILQVAVVWSLTLPFCTVLHWIPLVYFAFCIHPFSMYGFVTYSIVCLKSTISLSYAEFENVYTFYTIFKSY